ncbi:uncharacterized protein N0V89_004262 [Didymosphaeria variabile]|uniref:Uncharacterized protein n=1 Tax=Didymosphaeria variabile TaxID=1932322 RepID=A0A9W9CD98_9PLEO|nr:uncharacterized protein N0V89_004262 [Didymosphaeria variabile]KAJ4356232.1 hypothetical protein N0V89_004262 [Didymosphaeria variabile]
MYVEREGTAERPAAHPANERHDDSERTVSVTKSFTRAENAKFPTYIPAANPLRFPTYVKVSKEHLAIDTLLYYDIPYEVDRADPNYIIIVREMEPHETEVLFQHTRRLRSRGRSRLPNIEIEKTLNNVRSTKSITAGKLKSVIMKDLVPVIQLERPNISTPTMIMNDRRQREARREAEEDGKAQEERRRSRGSSRALSTERTVTEKILEKLRLSRLEAAGELQFVAADSLSNLKSTNSLIGEARLARQSSNPDCHPISSKDSYDSIEMDQCGSKYNRELPSRPLFERSRSALPAPIPNLRRRSPELGLRGLQRRNESIELGKNDQQTARAALAYQLSHASAAVVQTSTQEGDPPLSMHVEQTDLHKGRQQTSTSPDKEKQSSSFSKFIGGKLEKTKCSVTEKYNQRGIGALLENPEEHESGHTRGKLLKLPKYTDSKIDFDTASDVPEEQRLALSFHNKGNLSKSEDEYAIEEDGNYALDASRTVHTEPTKSS